MTFKKLRQAGGISDSEFDLIYPPAIRQLSARHWTSVLITRIASDFLCYKKGAKVLDIGSGVGKFCLVGATLHPDCFFDGIELRNGFTGLSEQIRVQYDIKNVSFIKGDIIDNDIQEYNGIYFFNSFHEQIDSTSSFGENNYLIPGQYTIYVQHLFEILKKMSIGTRIVTYHTSDFFIPDCFEIIEQHFGGTLKCYQKTMKDSGDILAERTIANHILLYGA